MNTEDTTAAGVASAEPGRVSDVSAELGRARDASMQARFALKREERRLAAYQGASGPTGQAERIEAARLDLDAAEAFEESLENGNV